MPRSLREEGGGDSASFERLAGDPPKVKVIVLFDSALSSTEGRDRSTVRNNVGTGACGRKREDPSAASESSRIRLLGVEGGVLYLSYKRRGSGDSGSLVTVLGRGGGSPTRNERPAIHRGKQDQSVFDPWIPERLNIPSGGRAFLGLWTDLPLSWTTEWLRFSDVDASRASFRSSLSCSTCVFRP